MQHLQPTMVVRTTRFINLVHEPGDDQEKKDWITFLTRAHEMTEEEVAAQIKTPEVLQAFEKAKFSNFTPELRASYEAEARERNDTAELIRLACETTEKSAKAKRGFRRGHLKGSALKGRLTLQRTLTPAVGARFRQLLCTWPTACSGL